MKCVDYNIHDDPEIRRLAEKLVHPISGKFVSRYNCDYSKIRMTLNHELVTIMAHTRGKIKKIKVLDLGSGCNPSLDFTETRNYEPWLCRLLYAIGAHPIGIDYGKFEGEEFEHHSIDLMVDNLNFMKDNSIDVAHARLLFCSSTLKDREGEKRFELQNRLYPQLERIVKPEGFYIVNDV